MSKPLCDVIFDEWIKRLESGEYRQCVFSFHNEEGGHCALGILDLVVKDLGMDTMETDNDNIKKMMITVGLPGEMYKYIWSWNDVAQIPFEKIAAKLKQERSK